MSWTFWMIVIVLGFSLVALAWNTYVLGWLQELRVAIAMPRTSMDEMLALRNEIVRLHRSPMIEKSHKRLTADMLKTMDMAIAERESLEATLDELRKENEPQET